MGKFVARTFVPGEKRTAEDEILTTWAFDTAWEAWEHHKENRVAAEALGSGDPARYGPKLYSAWGDMNELAEPRAYDDNGRFGVKSVGHDWFWSQGTGVIWAPTPGATDKRADKGICYQVCWEEEYNGL